MILHVDMDAFYASVEERDRPELVGKPVIVGGTPQGRGVVAAANYVVRKFGVHSAMPAATALRLCPQAIVLPPRLDYYAEVSRADSRDPLRVHAAGRAALAGRSLPRRDRQRSPVRPVGRDRPARSSSEIREQVRLVASVGVAPNKFLAKIASDLEKPDGFVVVEPAGVQEFLDPLPVGRLWGVGRVTGEALERLGVRTIGDVAARGRWPSCNSTSATPGSICGNWRTASTTGRSFPTARPSRSRTRRRSPSISTTGTCFAPGCWNWPSRSAGVCGGTICAGGPST